MLRRKLFIAFAGFMLVAQTGCSVDLNGTAATVMTGIVSSLFGTVVAGAVNSVIPVAG